MANGDGKAPGISLDRKAGSVTFNFKTLAYIATLACVIIGASWTLTMFCDRSEIRAAAANKRIFTENFDYYYPIKHASCDTAVKKLKRKAKKSDINQLEIRLMFQAMANQEQKDVAKRNFSDSLKKIDIEDDEE